MKKMYEKDELIFSLVWIGIYCVVQSLAGSLDGVLGIKNLGSALCCLILSCVLFVFLKRNGLLKKYGLCKAAVPARVFLFYIPLAVVMSGNLWYGLHMRYDLASLFFHILLMLGVGFMEEVIFRGLLFKAMEKSGLKSAIIVSSLTFGIGHIINLFNGSGMALVENVFQMVAAVVYGFLFVMLFYRSGSLIPCILAHSGNNILSAFANEAGVTTEKRILFTAVRIVLIAAYLLMIEKLVSKEKTTK